MPNIFVLLNDVKNISDALECLDNVTLFGALTSLSINMDTDHYKNKQKSDFLCKIDNLNYKKLRSEQEKFSIMVYCCGTRKFQPGIKIILSKTFLTNYSGPPVALACLTPIHMNDTLSPDT